MTDFSDLVGKSIRVRGVPATPTIGGCFFQNDPQTALYGIVEVEDVVSEPFGQILHVLAYDSYARQQEPYAIESADFPDDGFTYERINHA